MTSPHSLPTTSELEASLTVLKDTGNKAILAINVPGLKKRKGFFFRICNLIRKSRSPFHLTENAKFGEYSLTNSSFIFVVEVYENSKALKIPGSARQKYACRILQLPSRINPESAEFELHEGASGECYFLLTCIKLDNYQTNWKEFLANNATLDASKLQA